MPAGGEVAIARSVDGEHRTTLQEISAAILGTANSRRSGEWFNAFSVQDIESVRDELQRFVDLVEDAFAPAQITEDAPMPKRCGRIGHETGRCRRDAAR